MKKTTRRLSLAQGLLCYIVAHRLNAYPDKQMLPTSSKRRLSRQESLLFAAPLLVLALVFGPTLLKQPDKKQVPPGNVSPLPSRRPVKPSAGHSGQVMSLTFSPDGRLLASAGGGSEVSAMGSEVIVWSIKKQVLKVAWKIAGKATAKKNTADRGRINSLSFSPDGKSLALGGDARKYTPVKMPDGRPAFSETMSGLVELRAVKTGKLQRTIAVPHAVRSVAFSPDGELLALGSGMSGAGEVRMLAARTGKLKWMRPDKEKSPNHNYTETGSDFTANPVVHSVAFSPDGKILATVASLYGQSNGTSGVHFWDTQTGQLQRATPDGSEGYGNGSDELFALAFAPKGQLLAVNRLGATVKRTGITLWDAHMTKMGVPGLDGYSGSEPRQLRFPNTDVLALAFSPDGKTIAGGGGTVNFMGLRHDQWDDPRGKVRFWNVQTGEVKRTLKIRDLVTAIAVSPDGAMLATGTSGLPWGEVKLWDVSALSLGRPANS